MSTGKVLDRGLKIFSGVYSKYDDHDCNGSLAITVVKLNSSGDMIRGTFSGSMSVSSGNIYSITNGIFVGEYKKKFQPDGLTIFYSIDRLLLPGRGRRPITFSLSY
jgi:hypothetical protein